MDGSYGREVIYLRAQGTRKCLPKSEKRSAGHEAEFSLTASGEDGGAVFPMEP